MNVILISSNCSHSKSNLKSLLASQFSMKDIGIMNYFLGLEIDMSDAGFFMSHKRYTLDLIKEFGMITSILLYKFSCREVKMIASILLPIHAKTNQCSHADS